MCQNGFNGMLVLAVNYGIETIVNQIRRSGINIQTYGICKAYLNRKWNTDVDIEKELTYPIDYYKPELFNFEYHVAYHCSLKCKGCYRLSNVAEPEFGDFEQYVQNLRRLKELFWSVMRISLLGVEHLLNPELPQFIYVTRELFPGAKLFVTTNGLCFPTLDKEVLNAMKECRVILTVSGYPPTMMIMERIRLKCMEYEIELDEPKPNLGEFRNVMNKKGDSNIMESYRICVVEGGSDCHILYNGKLFNCPMPMIYLKYRNLLDFDEVAVTAFEADVINLYQDDIDGAETEEKNNEGTLIIDATCTPQNISYPQDINLLNEAREDLEGMIDQICYEYGSEKPRTYRGRAEKM